MAQSSVIGNQLKDNTLHLDDLKISFHRTVRVPDNAECAKLPPNLGKFPLYQVKSYEAKLPPNMVAKGGLFFPMYRKLSAIISRTSPVNKV
jgi:hypothetical protein